jgi:hypothetical protein
MTDLAPYHEMLDQARAGPTTKTGSTHWSMPTNVGFAEPACDHE